MKNSVDSLNDDEILAEIYRIVASVGDGHTKVISGFTEAYAINFYCFKDGIYAINTIDKYKEALYCKLIKINGQDIKSIEEKISPLIAQENQATIKKLLPGNITVPKILHGVKVIDDVDKEVDFTFEDKEGKTFDLNIEPVDIRGYKDLNWEVNNEYDESYPLYMQKQDLNYWYQYLEKDKVLYLKYNMCLEDEKTGNLDDFNNEVLNFIDNNEVDKFVIDIRDNSGGGEGKINDIIEGIKNSKLNNKKNFYVIVGRRTFSAAILDAVKWRKETNATFIGEKTSGKPNHYGLWGKFKLPNSNLTIQYSSENNST